MTEEHERYGEAPKGNTVVVKEGLKYSTAAFIALIVFAIGFVVGFATSRSYSPCIDLPTVTTKTDTVTVRDTIAGVVQPPKIQTIVRVDTVRLEISPTGDGKYQRDTNTRQSIPDTSTTPRKGQGDEVLIPISSKVYETKDYKAVVSGWRPSLDSIEVYRDTQYINTVRVETRTKRPWLALTAGGGVGYAPSKAVVPVVGLGIGIVLKSW